MKGFIRYLKKICMRTLLFPLRIFPVRNNRLFMHNDLSYNYSENPKYVTEYLLEKYNGKFEIIISAKQPQKYTYLNERGLIDCDGTMQGYDFRTYNRFVLNFE